MGNTHYLLYTKYLRIGWFIRNFDYPEISIAGNREGQYCYVHLPLFVSLAITWGGGWAGFDD